MNKTIEQAIECGKKACAEYGFGFMGIYESNCEGWDRFIVSPVHVSAREYKYMGFVKQSGEFVGRNA